MFSIHAGALKMCDGIARRDFLRIGTLGCLGITCEPGWRRPRTIPDLERRAVRAYQAAPVAGLLGY